MEKKTRRDPMHDFELKNYDHALGKVEMEGKFGRMKLVELDYDNFYAKYIMLDDGKRIQWTTFEFLPKSKFYHPIIAWFLQLFYNLTHA